MAVILRGGTPNPQANSGFPLRSSIIEINKDGSVKLLSTENKQISALNLGYQGDHRVTQLIVKPWISATTLNPVYEACLVFYNEKEKETYTATLTPSGSEYTYNIEDVITQYGGNFQVFFVLKERLESGTSGVGVAGEPAYREVFISEGFKGAIDMNSGYQFMNNFD